MGVSRATRVLPSHIPSNTPTLDQYGQDLTELARAGKLDPVIGREEEIDLTETVRRRPYCVLLLDEMDKAHRDAFNTMLQILDDGRLTDGQGRTADFRNTVVIMTSNRGLDIISKSTSVGFITRETEMSGTDIQDRVLSLLREEFRPEFFNRIDEIVAFRRLNEQQLHKITSMLLEETRQRLSAQHITIEFEPAVVNWLTRHGHQPEFGPRPLRRTIQREVDNRLSSMLLNGELKPEQHVRVGIANQQPSFAVDNTQSN